MDTRKWDLLELMKSREQAKNAYERDSADRAIGSIRSESKQVEGIRKNLVQAYRNRDNHAVKRFQHELMSIRADETYGKEF